MWVIACAVTSFALETILQVESQTAFENTTFIMVGFHDSDLTTITTYYWSLGKVCGHFSLVLRANKEEWIAGQWQEQLCQPVSGR